MKSRNRKIEILYLALRALTLGSFRSFTKSYKKDELSVANIKSILVMRLDRIGDMVTTTPIFRALKEKWPGVQVTVLANPVNKNVIINNPFIDCILVYDRENKHKSFNSRLTFFRSIRERGFDLVIDPYLDYELKTSFIARFIGNRFRLGFEFAGKGIFYNIRYHPNYFPVITEKKHMIDYHLDLLTCLGIETKKRQPEIFLSSDEKENASKLLKKNGVNLKNRFIGIHPGAHHESKRWPIEKFAAISDYLIANNGKKVILFAGKEEKQLLSEFKGYAVKTPIILEDLSLREFMSVLGYCKLFLCNNSGPLNIAAALNIPTVSTMGPTIPFLWRPYGKDHIVLKKDVDCSPCKHGICKTHECMELITTEDFIEAVERQIRVLDIFPSSKSSFRV